MSGNVTRDEDDRIATITIENSGKRNALSPSMLESLRETYTSLQSKEDIRTVVLRGAGTKTFSSGFDIDAFEDSDPMVGDQAIESATDAIREYPGPTIARIDGDVFGGAVELTTACDLRIAAADAQIGIPVAQMGLVYSGRAVSDLVELIGPSYTKELLYTAEPVSAEKAADLGLVNRAVAAEELSSVLKSMADRIASNAPLSIEASKHTVDTITAAQELSAAEKRRIRNLMSEAAASDDHQEALAAFEADREPEFSGE